MDFKKEMQKGKPGEKLRGQGRTCYTVLYVLRDMTGRSGQKEVEGS